jgi:hypothetical protein
MTFPHTGKKSAFQAECGNKLRRQEEPRRVKVLATSDLIALFDTLIAAWLKDLRFQPHRLKVCSHASSPDCRFWEWMDVLLRDHA